MATGEEEWAGQDVSARHSVRRLFVSLVIAGLTLVIASCMPPGLDPTGLKINMALVWDPSPDTAVVGYKLYRGIASGNYTTVVDVGAAVTYTATGLTRGQTVFFAVTAYDASGGESIYSNELSQAVF